MNLATWSMRKPVPSILLFCAMALAGGWGFSQLHVQYMPDLTLPSVRVHLTQPGAAPAQLETSVARKVEDALAPVRGVAHIETTISEGAVDLMVRFDIGKNLSDALIDVKDAVDHVRVALPPELEPASIASVIPFNNPVMKFAVSSERLDETELSWFVDDTLAKALSAVHGMGRFERIGGVQREVRVELHPGQLAALGVTAADVSRALHAGQLQATGGRSQLGGQEQSIRIIAGADQAAALKALPVALADGRHVRLDQVAGVEDVAAERSQLALLDGRPVIGFNLYRAPESDEIAFDDDVRHALAELQALNPTLRLTAVSNDVDYTREQYRGSMDMLYEGAVLAVLVVWFFLRDWRATLIAASALPLSILPVFGLMHLLNFSLNTLSLLALSAVIGILVDDAIVEIENIVRHARAGTSIAAATAEAVQEIALAVTATTLTLAAVFLPTALMHSVPGLFFREFGWTAAIAVLFSLLVARLMTPMLAARFLRQPAAGGEPPSPSVVMRGYLGAARWCLAHRAATLTVAALLFAGSLALVPLLPTGLLPASDRGYIALTLELPPGSSLDDTAASAEAARAAIIAIPGVRHVMASVGNGDKDHAALRNRGNLIVVLADAAARRSQAEIEATLRVVLAGLPGARVEIGGGNDDKQLELIVASDDDAALKADALRLERELRQMRGLAGVISSASQERPELVIRPLPARAADFGVSTQAIADTIRIATVGDLDAQLAKLDLDARQLPIAVRVAGAVRGDLDALAQLRVPGRDGPVPLGQVASLSVDSGPAQIERYDRKRYISIRAALDGLPLGTALDQARALPAAQQMAPNVSLSETGNADNMKALLSGFLIAIVSGVLCVYCLLVLLFEDFAQPFTILSALPMSVGGGFVALLAMHGQLNVPALIGMVMLMGIVTKNSILLVEYALLGLRKEGLTVSDALLAACRHRARPIVMTTVAMVAGMLPIALGLGADASFRRPMAVAVIGGLISSTALSLLVVPVVFSVVADAQSWWHLGLRRMLLWRWLRYLYRRLVVAKFFAR